jgi:crotonobetainyl-CoA:carnitine CoA-transferase CaiB-like acyl-CoA transferase
VDSNGDAQLAGLTVLELGSLIAGPFCTRLLGDMGARVIKIEPPGTGDPLRGWSLVTEHGSLWSMVQSRNKESVAVDLHRPAGQDLVRRLADRVDVLVENFRPGRMESWGLAPDRLREHNPRLIVVRISGYGQTGPYSQRPGFGSTAEALGGLRFITGFPDRPPLKTGISLGDSVGALYAAMGTLAALNRRSRTGRGEVVDVALHEAVFSLLESVLPEYGFAGTVRERRGNALLGSAPSNVYPTRDGSHIAIGANGDSVFSRFCSAIGRPDLAADARFSDNQSRRANVTELDEVIEAWTLGRTLHEAWETLNEAAVPAAPVYTVADMVRDEQYLARDMVLEIDGPADLGRLLVPGVVPKFEEAPAGVRSLGPPVGRDTEAVLRGELGLSADQVARLAADGVVGLEDRELRQTGQVAG